MSIYRAENLLKTYGEKQLFDHISFTIEEKDRIGLIGVNGTGKSTLLKVLARIEGKESGEIIHSNGFEIEYLPQEPTLNGELTVLEQVYYGDSKIMKTMREYEQAVIQLEQDPLNESHQKKLAQLQQRMDEEEAWEANTVAKTILTKLGINDFSKQVKHLSGGQKKRVAIAKALIQPVDLLLLDEPTNHLDNETIEWLEDFLSSYRGALIVITHDRYFLNRVTNTIFELDKGNLYQYKGNYETFLEEKARREEVAEQRESKRQNLLRREIAWLKRGAKARTTKQKARIQRAEKLQEEKHEVASDDLDFAIGSTRLGKKVIELEKVSKQFDQDILFKDVSYLVVPGERLGIIGPNGTGKSTLLNVIAGRIKPDTGEVTVGETVKIGYYKQDHEEIDSSLRVVEYIKEVAEVVKTVDGQIITAEQMLERFMFPRAMQWTYISRLSGGERRRLYLLKVLMEEPNVLFLDEPTNDLDTQTLAILEDYLDQFPGVVITVSHDRFFLDRVVDRLLVFIGDGHVTLFQGSYSDYLSSRKLGDKNKHHEEPKRQETERVKAENKRKKLSYKDQIEWDGIEDRIAGLEEKKEKLEQDIIEAGSDHDRIRSLYEEQTEVEEEIEKAMERWEELSILVEEIEAAKK
ncbi:ABC-F family ATP-binding cassette domain-containing protein [Evansella cellulosilytica]|uniref:ABC transporter related protein n=1 Tax=Evansella cellulosilytica (strain ATCC 21833 / DSM 2522 / FERM P-1141 / JCM 9156 / N-4) TaxID=649639 RepID=E6U043_EVAC2|nr:ABC-F family ATP-binding cassette domain-containing protein [Evansella cellulosilytica]ADU29047.1 ABC transporter related protein [Evansella cellulosilytica DSM 2522]